jgi:hypothetical protein
VDKPKQPQPAAQPGYSPQFLEQQRLAYQKVAQMLAPLLKQKA